MTKKQRMFVERYLLHFNATKAAIECGYSEKSAHAIAHENLRKPEIKIQIANRLAAIGETLNLTRELLVTEIQTIAFNMTLSPKDRLKALELLLTYLPENKVSHNPHSSLERLKEQVLNYTSIKERK